MSKKIALLLSLAMISCGFAQTESPKPGTTGQQSSITPPSKPASPSLIATVDHFKLNLAHCQLTYEGLGKTGTIDFGFPAPCQFGQDAKGQVRVVRTGKTHTLVVESSRPADPATRLAPQDCHTLLRGVIVAANEIRLSTQTQKVAQCAPAQWDEKLFHSFAANTQSIDVSAKSTP